MSDEDDLFASLEDTFKEVEQEGVEDLTEVPSKELLERYYELDEFLVQERQVLRPDTQEARDAHSERYGIMHVLRKRGLL